MNTIYRTRKASRKIFLPVALLLVQLTSCTTNPVTGERNFQIYGSAWEQEVGALMYEPMRQSQGGDFILDPELTAYVQEVGNRLAARARRKDELEFKFSIINSSVPNAWALPGGKIVVNRGLLTELDSEAELAAVLGHEIVHADAAHGARQQSTGMLAQIGAVASMVIIGTTVKNETAQEISMLLPTLGAQLIMQRYGRDAERESDEYGMLYMSEANYDPQGAVQLQETFVKLSEGHAEDWLSGLFASHPPSSERLENNRRTATKLPAKGEMGSQIYHQKTAYLKRVKPAYTSYDEAAKALIENQLDLAQSKLDHAMSIEPRESLFLSLQGDIYMQRKDPKRALAAYDSAARANETYFYAFLRKGQLEFDGKKWGPARANLEKSLGLLPTAEAHYLLGVMDRNNGREETAVEHFREASKSRSEAGINASKELIRLDLDKNPSRYFTVQASLDKSNNVWILLGNNTGVEMKNIEIGLAWLDEKGATHQDRKLFKGPLAGGKKDQLPLGLKINDVGELSSRIRLEVLAAEIVQ